MITAGRENENLLRNEARSKLGLLERKPVAFNEEVASEVTITPEEDRERMSRNFAKLISYEKTLVEQEQQEELKAQAQVVCNATASTDEDIMPSSTTLQFGKDNTEVYTDMQNVDKHSIEMGVKPRFKLMAAVYAVVATVLLALVVINTGMITSLRQAKANVFEEYTTVQQQYEEAYDNLQNVSSDEHVIDLATGEYNMVK